MWSGPRTISTALMRAFENRPDTAVVDEPLYGYYLSRTGLDHPGAAEVIASMDTDWRGVLARLRDEPPPDGASIWYAKHMAHHVLGEVELSALTGFRHAFLIRDPRALLASYARVRSAPSLGDLGLARQVEIFRAFGGPVIDASDVLADPRAALSALCSALGIVFSETMLRWPSGSRPTDGVWAKYWYGSVWRSTGFGPAREPASVPQGLEPLAAACQPYYRELAVHRLRP